MPSIPQSLLWISLVVLWLFVLVPMLISKRDAVRRTSDVALATRVLNGGARPGCSSAAVRPQVIAVTPTGSPRKSRIRRRPPGRRRRDERRGRGRPADARRGHRLSPPLSPRSRPDYLDVDVVDPDSAALPVGASAEADDDDRGRRRTPRSTSPSSTTTRAKRSTTTPISTNTSTTPRGYRSARSRRDRSRGVRPAASLRRRTRPPRRSAPASTSSASAC